MFVLVLVGSALANPDGLASEEPLPAGFLEFLGAMVEANGELIDPLNLATPAERILLEEIEKDEARFGKTAEPEEEASHE